MEVSLTMEANTMNPDQTQIKIERAVDGAPWQIPTLKFLTPPAPCSPTPGHDLGNRMKILFNLSGEHTQNFG